MITQPLPARVAQMAEQNAAMRQALDVIRENEFLRETLADKGIPVEEPVQSMAMIAALVATRHSCSVAELRGPARERCIAWPRQEAMWLMRQVLTPKGEHRFSLLQIGRFLGDRDHTTVLHGIRKHDGRRALAQQEAA